MKRTRLVMAIGAVVLVVVVGVWLVSRGSAPAAEPSAAPGSEARSPSSSGLPSPSTAATSSSSSNGIIRATSDPDEFARAVTAVVFGMDTRELDAAGYRELLLESADPMMSASGLDDLELMVDERIPAADLWERMRANEQWSEWASADAFEPGSWAEVVTSGQAEPGWAMRNVTGQQTTHYVENGEDKVAARERTLTVGMRCPAPEAPVDHCGLNLIGTSVLP